MMQHDATASQPLLEVKDLVLRAREGHRELKPADGVSFSVARGEALGIIGESGSGKSLTMASIIGLLPPGIEMAGGSIIFNGAEMRGRKRLRSLRGCEIGLIFQDPMSGLNPAFKIGSQFSEILRVRRGLKRREAKSVAIDALRDVQITSPERRLGQFPAELSGGMRQRVLIAMALSLQPSLIIADEPTTGLDTTVQAELLDLLRGIVDEGRASLIIVTHDLGVTAAVADRVAVMYAGKIVEIADAGPFYENPRHPYPASLLAAAPTLDANHTPRAIPGQPPHLSLLPNGCSFHPRCPLAIDKCVDVVPELVPTYEPSWLSACHRWRDMAAGDLDMAELTHD